jgi:CSLREA domain-containing protein
MPRRHAALPLLTLAVVLSLPAVAQAATINVTTTADVTAADAACSLREAVQAANNEAAGNGCPAGSGADTIVLPAGLYKLDSGSGQLAIGADLTMRGAGVTTVIEAVSSRILAIAALDPPEVTLEGITFRNGHAPDGGNGGNATGGGGSSATGGAGGAGGDGGAILNNGATLTVIRCVFENNRAGDGGAGGTGTGGDGGTGGTAFGSGGNGGAGGSGGAIYSLSPLVVRESSFASNHGGTGGAGGAGAGGDGGAPASTTANGRGGAVGDGGIGGKGGDGGAILTGTMAVEYSTFVGNAAGTGGAGGPGVGGVGGVSGATGGAGGIGGLGAGDDGGAGGSGGTFYLAGGASDVTSIRFTTIRESGGASGGVGGNGVGGKGGASLAPGAIGGFGGGANGGPGGEAGRGGAVFGRGLTIDASYIGATSGGSGGAGGAATSGAGGDATNESAESPGGPAGAATGGTGGAGGLGGVLATTVATPIANTTLDGSTFGAGGPGGPATASAGGANSKGGFGAAGVASGGPGGQGGVAGLWNDTGLALRHVTAVSLGAPVRSAGGAASSGPGGSATGGSEGSLGYGAIQGLNNGSLTSTLIVDSSPRACSGALTSGGHNLEKPHAAGAETCPATVIADPQLAPAGDFGGPTWTRRPGNAVPVDLVPTGAACLSADQRGVTRPRGSACDVGAYERAAPAATTGAADGVTNAGATLRGTANATGPAGTMHFEYGTTTAYGQSTAAAALPGGLVDHPHAAALAALLPGTTYHYRLVATTPDGSATGADATFTTTGTAPVPGGGTLGDRTAPRFLSAALKPVTFAVRRKGSTRNGSRLRWKLTETAKIVATVARATTGRRSGTRCVALTKKNARAKRCTRYRTVGRITIAKAALTGSYVVTGRLGTRALAAGRYRLTLVATDAAGNASAPRQLTFKIKRAKRRTG